MTIKEKIIEAEQKALDSLSRYKFLMFGYWAAIWVHLNRIAGNKEKNPFTDFVKLAKKKTSGAESFYCHDHDLGGKDKCISQCAGCKEWF